MSISTIPRELFLEIAANTNIDDLSNVAHTVAGVSLEDINERRRDPNRYFQELLPDTQKLLRSMIVTGTILSGSRAAGYFYPSACGSDSEWDFYCPGYPLSVARFASSLSEMGVVWKPSPRHLTNRSVEWDPPKLSILDGYIGSARIQLVWRAHSPPMQLVMGLHSSVVQCFLTGYCAVSMYHDLSRKSLTYLWYGTGVHDVAGHAWLLQKYRARGFNPMRPPDDENGRMRRVSDGRPLLVDTLQYVKSLCPSGYATARLMMRSVLETRWVQHTLATNRVTTFLGPFSSSRPGSSSRLSDGFAFASACAYHWASADKWGVESVRATDAAFHIEMRGEEWRVRCYDPDCYLIVTHTDGQVWTAHQISLCNNSCKPLPDTLWWWS